jgi:hypothetical protein
VAIQVAYGDAMAMLKVGEEEPGGVMKTMRRWRHPALREVARWKLATSSQGDEIGDLYGQKQSVPKKSYNLTIENNRRVIDGSTHQDSHQETHRHEQLGTIERTLIASQ